jgi:hypothetical protein
MAKTAGKPAVTENQDVNQNAMTMLEGIIEELETLIRHFTQYEFDHPSLTGRERQRLFGAGIRNYGFIEKAMDIARENPQFNPPNFNVKEMYDDYRLFEEIRQTSLVLQQFQQMMNDYMIITSDKLYRDALRIYGSLREQSRNRVPGSQPLFDALLRFFRHRRRPGAEPSQKQLEHDFHSLLHGTADGEIIIQNERPHAIEGVRKILDNVHRGRLAIKESAEITEKE